ncbi:MAG: hypothetical protein WAO58_08860 [Fimbriimonadaceae bacterium]
MKRVIHAWLGLTSLTTLGLAQGSTDIVISGDKGYALISPEVISQPIVQDFNWSDDGKFLLYIRREPLTVGDQKTLLSKGEPPTQVSLSAVVWNASTKKQHVLRKLSGPSVELEAHWLKGTRTILLNTMGPTTREGAEAKVELIRANAESGATQIIYSADRFVENPLTVSISPASARAVVVDYQDSEQGSQDTVAFEIGPAGPPTASIRIPNSSGWFSWDDQGQPYTHLYKRMPGAKPVTRFLLLDFASGKTAEVTKQPDPYNTPQKDQAIGVELDSGIAISPETTRPSRNAWVTSAKKSRRNFAFVAANVELATLSNGLDYVAYTSEGVLLVRPIVIGKASDFEEALDAAERAVLISNAKQVGLSALMYAGDNDDVLPGPGQDVMNLFLPYSKNSALYDGFVYTFSGGALQKVANVSDTEMGYIPGKGGRAVIYVDGHVKWVKN